LGNYFNKQTKGFRLRDVKNDIKLGKLIEPLATFQDTGRLLRNMSFVDAEAKPYKDELEFVAIAEGKELPIYIFTYNVEMTQFVSTDIARQPEQLELIDKSIAARHHA